MNTRRLPLLALFAALISSCVAYEFESAHPNLRPSAEDIGVDAFKQTAWAAFECKEARLELIKNSESDIKNLVKHIKRLHAESSKHASPAKSPEDTQEKLKFLVQVITSEGFKKMLLGASDVLKEIAHNEVLITNLKALHEDFGLEPGDRLAELLTMLATDPKRQQILLAAVKTAKCSNSDPDGLSDSLLTPEVLWALGPNFIYLANSELREHANQIYFELKSLELPKELAEFIQLVDDARPKTDICQIDNLDPHRAKFLFLADLLAKDTPESPRPLRRLLNTLFTFYTMSTQNNCQGTSFDEISSENIQEAFLTLSDFIRDEETGVVGFVQKVKSR